MGWSPPERCDRFAVDTYEREVERYGGPEGMAAAEELFAADSRCVAGLLGCLRGGLGLDRVGLAVVTVDDLLDALGLDPRRRLEWCGGRVADRRASGPEHRRRKAILRPLLADPRRLGSVPGGREVLGLLAERRAALAPIAERLGDLALGTALGTGPSATWWPASCTSTATGCSEPTRPPSAWSWGCSCGPARAWTGRRSPDRRPPPRPHPNRGRR